MERQHFAKRPSWWLLYAGVGVVTALVAFIEASVPGEQARVVLELLLVVVAAALMLRWIRSNRGRIELAEAPETRRAMVESPVGLGTPVRNAAPIVLAPSRTDRRRA